MKKVVFGALVMGVLMVGPVWAWDNGKIEREYQIDKQRFDAAQQRNEQQEAQHRMDRQMQDMRQRQDDVERRQRDADFRSRSPHIGQNY